MILPPSGEASSLTVQSTPIEIDVGGEGSGFSLILPPFEDMTEIAELKGSHFSMAEHIGKFSSFHADWAASELTRLRRRFPTDRSHTLTAHIAALASASGDLEEEGAVLAQAPKQDQYILIRLGENLNARARRTEAEVLFSSPLLRENIHALLRLASFKAVDGEILEACAFVERAIEIDPLNFAARLFNGALLIALGKFPEAIHNLKFAAQERSNSAVIHIYLAVAYYRTGRKDRAMTELRMAVAIDPLSESAVNLLADISDKLDAPSGAIPSLRLYVQFEQKSAAVWARLGRALYSIGEFGEALSALKRQASLSNTSAVWNNIGVIHNARGDVDNALKAFRQAMQLSPQFGKDYFIAAANLASVAEPLWGLPDSLKFISSILELDSTGVLRRDSRLVPIYGQRFNIMLRAGLVVEAIEDAKHLLELDDAAVELRYLAIIGLLYVYSIEEGYTEEMRELANNYGTEAFLNIAPTKELRSMLVNNLAFVAAELGELDRAAQLLTLISDRFHRDAYPTATLGLLNLRRGRTLRASALYQEALRLARSVDDKAKIRQKWNLEIGNTFRDSDPRRALRHFEKAAEEKLGEKALSVRARKFLKALPATKR